MASSEEQIADQEEAVEEQDVLENEATEQTSGGHAAPADYQEDGNGGTEAAEASNAGWQQELENAGFRSFDDIDNAVKALVESNRQRDEQIRTYADQIRYYQDQVQSARNNHTAAPQEVANSPEPKDPLSSLVEDWQDPSWASQWIEIDEDGNRVISDSADDETREKIMGIDRKLRKWQEVLQDPRQFADLVDQRVEKMIQDRFESSYQMKQAQASENAALDDFINRNAHWMYRTDPATGQYLRDPVSGDFVMTEHGDYFTGIMSDLESRGMSSIVDRIQYAQRYMGSSVTQQQGHQQDSKSAAQQQRDAMRGRTNTNRSRQSSFNGVSASSGGDQTGMSQRSFGERTMAVMMTGDE